MKIKFHYFLFLFLFTKIASFIAYFGCEIFCVDDYIDYITSSNGNILPQIENHEFFHLRDIYFVFNFTQILHNFDQPICIHLVNYMSYGQLAFKYVSINEYDITVLNYEDFYSCNECFEPNGTKKFVTTSELCIDKNIISTGYQGLESITKFYNFCLDPKNDISSFFIDNSKINQNYYKGKEVKYILNDETININIDKIFVINENENLLFFLDTVSLKITSISNNKGIIYNGNEELGVNSFFNPKYKYLTYKRLNDDDGYIMTITIETKPKNQNIDIRTCGIEAKIYLYVPRKNCTMTEYSNNFCQKCININYSKNLNENKCYDKSEKFSNLYSESSSQTWKNCEKEKNSFICSICPEGTFIKNSLSQICERCPKGQYSNDVDQNKCQKCDKGYYSNILGSTSCQICPNGYFSPEGADKCSLCKEIIPNCNSCSKELKCLECNNEAVPGYGNCTICENDMDWIFLRNKCIRTTICDKYFYKDKNNNNKINCIKDINECPEEMIYLILDTGECKQNITIEETLHYKFQIKGGKEELDQFSQNFINKTFLNAFLEYLNKDNYTLKGQDSNLTLTHIKNLKGFDFGDCPYILRTQYKVNDIYVKMIQFEIGGKKNIHYNFIDNLSQPLNVSDCENQKVTILSNPPKETLYYFTGIEKFQSFYQNVKENIELFNIHSKFYNEYCLPVSVLDKYDLTLDQRREFLKEKNLSFCGDDCEYEGENLEKLELRCRCPLKVDTDQEILKQFEEKNITKTEELINYKIVTCYKLNFSLEGQRGNYFSYLYIFLFVLDIILIIINEIFLKKNLNDLIECCKEYILKNNSNDDNIKNKEFKELRYVHLNKLDNNELNDNFKKFKFQKIESNPPKKHQRSIKNTIKEKEEKEEKLTELTIEDLGKVKEGEIGDNNDDYYYIYLIYVYKKKDRKRFLIDKELNDLDFNLYKNIESRSCSEIYWSIFKKQYSLISTFFIFNTKNNYKEYKLYIIKIMIYISSFTFSVIIDILFYNNKTMKKLIEENEEFNLKYKLPRIIILVIANDIFSFLFECLIDYQDKLIDLKINLDLIDKEKGKIENNNLRICNPKNKVVEIKINSNSNTDDDLTYNNSEEGLKRKNTLMLKNNKLKISYFDNIDNRRDKKSAQINNKITDNIEIINNNNKRNKKETKEEMAKNIEKSFRKRRIIFYVIILIFKLFSWYFISCFCALYKNTQKSLAKDIFVLGMFIDLISSSFISFYSLIIRIFIIRSSFFNGCIKIFNSNKCLKNSKLKCILNFINEKVIIYAFQKGIELLFAVYISDKIPFLSDDS